MSEQHMHYAIDATTGKRIAIETAVHTRKGGNYICECCGKPLNVRKGEKTEHVFAHKSGECTDKWDYEFNNPWHLSIQQWLVDNIPGAQAEVVVTFDGTSHRTDVCLESHKVVIELQHSLMELNEFADRNRFYTSAGYKVVWIFDKINAFRSGAISQDDNFEEWYSDTLNGRVLYSKEPSNVRCLLQAYEPTKDIFVFFQKNVLQDNASMVFEELCYSKTVLRESHQPNGESHEDTLTFYVTVVRATSADAMLEFLQSNIETVVPQYYDFTDEEFALYKTSQGQREEDEKHDTTRQREELDEARSKDTPEERLLELAALEDQTGSIGINLLRNQKIKKNANLQSKIVSILKQNMNYPLAEAMVQSVEDNSVIDYIYDWSLQNQDICVKRSEPSLLRYYIATKTQSSSVIDALKNNKGDMVRAAIAQNPNTNSKIVCAMLNDVSADVAYAAAAVLGVEPAVLRQMRSITFDKMRDERKQTAAIEQKNQELKKREQAIKKIEKQGDVEVRKALKQAARSEKALQRAQENITKQRNAIEKKNVKIASLTVELAEVKEQNKSIKKRVATLAKHECYMAGLHSVRDILNAATEHNECELIIYIPSRHYVYSLESHGWIGWKVHKILNCKTYNRFYTLPDSQDIEKELYDQLGACISEDDVASLVSRPLNTQVERLTWILKRLGM